MAIDRLPALLRIPTVSVIPETNQTKTDADGRKRQGQEREHADSSAENAAQPQPQPAPVINIDGQLTGRLIDVTA